MHFYSLRCDSGVSGPWLDSELSLRTWPRADLRLLWADYFAHFWALRTQPTAQVMFLLDLSVSSWREACRDKLSSFFFFRYASPWRSNAFFVCLDLMLFFDLLLNYVFPSRLPDPLTLLTVACVRVRFQGTNQRRGKKESERFLVT